MKVDQIPEVNTEQLYAVRRVCGALAVFGVILLVLFDLQGNP